MDEPTIWKIWTKLHQEGGRRFQGGQIEQAVILMNVGHIATKWFNEIQLEHLLCFPAKRINFSSPNYVTSSAMTSSVLLGIGIPRERFEEHFGPLGKIAFVPEAGP